ncbi:MAG: hypothetical protein AAB575_05525 [Patescibacteria group bacterium]
MALDRPYYRIARNVFNSGFILDKRYASDRFSLVRAYHLIEDDLKRIIEFIEPADINENVFSHRLYELFLRCSTEFETNCKLILRYNGYENTDLTIIDYYKINKATKLSEYEIKINVWHDEVKIIKPFSDWSKGHTLEWYQDYNMVKHDRSKNFNKANFKNVVTAASCVLGVLCAQFDEYAFSLFHDEEITSQSDEDGFMFGANSLLNIKPFDRWEETEKYNFSWEYIKDGETPFRKYNF